jgi:molybdopterin synthase sulfur carrier subunit
VATVVLPRSLVALFPGADRRCSATGATVAEVIADLEDRLPGLADRLLAAGPVLREHLNVFVDGERAGLSTPVARDAVVHVIPAVSGG